MVALGVVLLSGYLLVHAASGMLRLLDNTATGLPAEQRQLGTRDVPEARRRYRLGTADALAAVLPRDLPEPYERAKSATT